MERAFIESGSAESVEEAWRALLPNLRIDEIDPLGFRFRWRAASAPGFTLVDYGITGRGSAVVDEPGMVIASQTMRARSFAGAASIDAQPPRMLAGPSIAAWDGDTAVRGVAVDHGLAQRVARQISGDDRLELRVLGESPVSPAAEAYWDSVREHAYGTLLEPPELDNPMVEAQTVRLVVEAMLHVFPTTFLDARRERPRLAPASVRRAQQFVEEHAQRPITVDDIARAARLSTRGLSAAFRSALGISPSVYLRTVRLEGTRRDLREGDATDGDTVARIAASWGFAHFGRFAGYYREAFGESPGQTLRS